MGEGQGGLVVQKHPALLWFMMTCRLLVPRDVFVPVDVHVGTVICVGGPGAPFTWNARHLLC